MMRETMSLMVQGTSSSAGKSLIVTALCRFFANKGMRVAPFKSQNMSLNAAVTPDGKEIARAQATQAYAARTLPCSDMAPVLLKPISGGKSQLIVHGKIQGSYSARDYQHVKERLKKVVKESLENLKTRYDVIIIEGAGSPVEMNLKQHDICNMFIAQQSQSPVLLVHNIDPGGMFAAFLGTLALLSREERRYVSGLLVNNIRGDKSLLDTAPAILRQYTQKDVLGMIPHVEESILPPPEDSMDYVKFQHRVYLREHVLDIVVLHLPFLSNMDDFTLLDQEVDVSVRLSRKIEDIRSCDLVIIPGSKSTVDDLLWMKKHHLDHALHERHQHDAPILGICAGYQMLGETIKDPYFVEKQEGNKQQSFEGLGILPIITTFAKTKTTHKSTFTTATPCSFFPNQNTYWDHVYEIHMGQVTLKENTPPLFLKNLHEPEGCFKKNTMGTLFHGLFDHKEWRLCFLNVLRTMRSLPTKKDSHVLSQDDRYNALSHILAKNAHMTRIEQLLLKQSLSEQF